MKTTGKTLQLFTALAALFFGFTAFAVGTFIPATNRVDMIYDDSRSLLYISSGGDVLRYDLTSDTFLTPFHVGFSLMGMDLSPDGNTLAVADAGSGGGSKWVHLIDLPSGAITEAYFTLGFLETGTFSVAYGNDSALMISSQFGGSGWVPLRRYDPVLGTVTAVASVSQNSMLSASADGSVVAVAQGDQTGGPVGRYSVSSQSITQSLFDASYFLYEIAVNRNGTQLAVPTSGGCSIYELSGNGLVNTNVIGLSGAGRPAGAVYHPSSDAVFFSWVNTGDVRVYQSVSWTELARFDFQTTFTSPTNAYSNGRMKISRDGAIIFAMVPGGVRYLRHNLVIPNYDYNHRLVISSSPAGLGTPSLPFGTNWVESIPDPTLTNQIDAVLTNGGSRFHCIGWSGTGSVPSSGATNSVTFVLTNYSTLTWNFAWDAYVAPPSGAKAVPGSYASVFGTSGLNTLTRGTGNARTYQMQFSAAALSGLPIGAQITELRFRQDSSAAAAFPSAPLSWTEYDVTLARASNLVSAMSLTFSNNMANPVLVKSGPLAVAANQFPAGSSPNPFAPFIVFDVPYTYQGGDLVMLFRHPGSSSTNSTFLDALSTSAPGYGTDFKAVSFISFTGTSGGQASVTIPQIVFNYSPTQTITGTGTEAVLAGAGGPPGGGYHLLASTNVFSPASLWTPVTGDVFDANGTFHYTNSITPGSPPRFFRVVMP